MTKGQHITLLCLFAWLWSVKPQQIGEDVCSCSPQRYQMTLDLDLSCPPVNITASDGVAATSCLITPFGNPSIEDLVPTSVRSIDILELGQDLRVLVQENFVGSFVTGDIFNYTSLAANPRSIDGIVRLPRAIQVNIIAVNQFDQVILNVFIVTFTNDCEAYPVVFRGQSAGWIRFTNLLPPRAEVCPFGIGTDAPTGMPSLYPSAAPSETTSDPSPIPTSGNPMTTHPPTDNASLQPTTVAPSSWSTPVPMSDTPMPATSAAPSRLTDENGTPLPSAHPSQESSIPTSIPSPEPSHSRFETEFPSVHEPTRYPQASVEPTYATGVATSVPTTEPTSNQNTELPVGSHPTDDPGTATATPSKKSTTFEPTDLPSGSMKPSETTGAPTIVSTTLPSAASASPVPSSSHSTLPTYFPTHTAFSMSMSMDLDPAGEFINDSFEFGNVPHGMELEEYGDFEVDGTN